MYHHQNIESNQPITVPATPARMRRAKIFLRNDFFSCQFLGNIIAMCRKRIMTIFNLDDTLFQV